MEICPMTLELAELRERADSAAPGRERWKLRHELCRKVVDDCDERLGGAKLADVDLAALDLLYMDVCEAWDAPVRERASRQAQQSIGEVQSLDIDKLAALVDAMERLGASRQVFKGIR